MKVLIVGLGSIANKHITALRKLKPDVELYALRSSHNGGEVENVCNVFSLDEVPSNVDFALIATPTKHHADSLRTIIPLGIPVFLEKPPLSSLDEAEEIAVLIEQNQTLVYTAFNLRFHPLILWLKDYIEGKRVVQVSSYGGSYLPDWRPNVDYRRVYSSMEEMGGGVHLDLTHEIDFIRFLFGEPMVVQSNLRKISDLEISSIDSARYWLDYPDKVISVDLNYFRRDAKRTVEVVTDTETIEVDLIRGTVVRNREELLRTIEYNIQESFDLQMAYFLECIERGSITMNFFVESLNTLKICLHGS